MKKSWLQRLESTCKNHCRHCLNPWHRVPPLLYEQKREIAYEMLEGTIRLLSVED